MRHQSSVIGTALAVFAFVSRNRIFSADRLFGGNSYASPSLSLKQTHGNRFDSNCGVIHTVYLYSWYYSSIEWVFAVAHITRKIDFPLRLFASIGRPSQANQFPFDSRPGERFRDSTRRPSPRKRKEKISGPGKKCNLPILFWLRR